MAVTLAKTEATAWRGVIKFVGMGFDGWRGSLDCCNYGPRITQIVADFHRCDDGPQMKRTRTDSRGLFLCWSFDGQILSPTPASLASSPRSPLPCPPPPHQPPMQYVQAQAPQQYPPQAPVPPVSHPQPSPRARHCLPLPPPRPLLVVCW